LTDYRLTEGKSYGFTIIRVIKMPPDGEEQYVVQSESGSKHLLPKQFYEHYQFQCGQTICCRVDKINCNGKIFLEPDHPGCKPGDLVDFSVIGLKVISNSFHEKETMLILKDPWKHPAFLNINDHDELAKAGRLQCRVERIKKGQLLISYPGIHQPVDLPEKGTLLEFIIAGIISLAENLEYYILHQNNSRHYLRCKYYSDYGFTKGTKVVCRVLDKPALFTHYLEPVHPYYEPGREYGFDFVSMEPTDSFTGEKENLIVIKDLLGHQYKLPYHGQGPPWPSRVKALVKDIRMSKCVLGIIEIV
jgi:hypothetical protein